jgi:hypothetical protein
MDFCLAPCDAYRPEAGCEWSDCCEPLPDTVSDGPAKADVGKEAPLLPPHAVKSAALSAATRLFIEIRVGFEPPRCACAARAGRSLKRGRV